MKVNKNTEKQIKREKSLVGPTEDKQKRKEYHGLHDGSTMSLAQATATP